MPNIPDLPDSDFTDVHIGDTTSVPYSAQMEPFRIEPTTELEMVRRDMLRRQTSRPPSAFTYFNSEGESNGRSPAKKLTGEEETKLQTARKQIDRDTSARRISASEDLDEREHEYRNLVLNQRDEDKSAQEIVDSELPICVDNIGGDTLRRVTEMGHPDVFLNRGASFFRCATCARDVHSYYMYFCLGHIYCAEHVPSVEMCSVCCYAKPDTKAITTFNGKDIAVCPKCLSRTKCQDCGTPISEGEVEVRRCESCRTRLSLGLPHRPWSSNLTYADDDKAGAIVQSLRIFSAETEFFTPSGSHMENLARVLPKEIGVAGDGSLRGRGHGVELQTPRLKGAKGEQLVTEMCAHVKAHGGEINASCGMHIHLNASDILPKSRKEYPKALIDLWKAHLAFEDVILSFVPYQRRFNRYSRPMRPYFSPVELNTIETMYGVEKLWYRQSSSRQIRESKVHHYHSSRYFGINLHPLLSGGHLEVRYHPGTTNAHKILEWANLHALILDAAVAGRFSEKLLAEAANTFTIGDKTALLFHAIKLAKKSQHYFFDRQATFRNKKADEGENTKDEPTPRLLIRPDNADL